jgi:hypothetical protein
MKPWWVSELAVTEEEYDKVVTAAMDEFDGQCCSIDWVIYTARKPFSATPESEVTAITITKPSATEESPIP